MMDILILRLDAPVISFGAPAIDRHGVIQPYPALSMMTGMIGNALGYDHSEFDKLQRLQERLQYAVREDRQGQRLRDYQTVDLSQPFMRKDAAWTTRGRVEERKGGAAATGTHERYRYYWADAVYTVALTVDPAEEHPTLAEIEERLKNPERPLFIGRKVCLPSTSLLVCRMKCESLKESLHSAPLSPRADEHTTYNIWWQADGYIEPESDQLVRPAVDQKDWANQIHVGERWIVHDKVTVTNRA